MVRVLNEQEHKLPSIAVKVVSISSTDTVEQSTTWHGALP